MVAGIRYESVKCSTQAIESRPVSREMEWLSDFHEPGMFLTCETGGAGDCPFAAVFENLVPSRFSPLRLVGER